MATTAQRLKALEAAVATLTAQMARLDARVTTLEAATADEVARLTTAEGVVEGVTTAVGALEGRVGALEGAPAPAPSPSPPPAGVEVGPVYYLPIAQFAHAVAAGITAGHYWVGGALDPLAAAAALGLRMDLELAAHDPANGTATPALITARLTAIRNGGYRATVRRVLLIDEPDLHPAGTWNLGRMRACYAAVKAVEPTWPVWVLVRAHASTLPQARPWFAPDLSDGIAWDPYLAAYGAQAEPLIEAEARVLRAELGPTKPLTCILQAGLVPWAVPTPTTPPVRPTADQVRTMGLAALAGGATDLGLWFEGDWDRQPTDAWTRIGAAVAAWRAR